MSKKAEEFLKFAVGRGRGVALQTGSSVLLGRGVRPTARELDAELDDVAVQSQRRAEAVAPASKEFTVPAVNVESKKGTSGAVVPLSANYFKLLRKTDFEFCLYRVDFTPDVELEGLRKSFVRSQAGLLGGYLFDGQSMIYTTRRLPEEINEFNVKSREGVAYEMIIKHTGTSIKQNDAMIVQIYNLILRRAMGGLEMQLVGRNLYDPKSKVLINEHKLELWPGYITSIRQHEEDILVCCEVSHKVMRMETTYDVLSRLMKEDDRNWQDNFKKEMIGSVVLTDYNNRTYRVDDVDFASSPTTTFDMNGQTTSYKDYYFERYSLKIKDEKQPMLISNPKPRDIRGNRNTVLFLVPELCRTTGLTDKMRSNFNMMKKLADHTQMKPSSRKERLLELTRRLHNSPACTKSLEAFNTDIDDELVSFQGRSLPQEIMIFGAGKEQRNDFKVDWTMGMKTNQMFKTVQVKRWAFIYPPKAASVSESILKLLSEVATGMKYDLQEALKIRLPDDRTASYTAKLAEIISKDPTFIMIVVPNNAADRYAAIKRLACVNNAVPTQVIVQKTITPKDGANPGALKSIATKIIVQVNCKLGGAPWMVKFPPKGVMTVGFDVNHDTSDRSKSYGAFVASMDLKENPEYYSAVSAHKNGEEISAKIGTHMINALKVYCGVHGGLPDRIFFYRDGVGEGQIEIVQKMEVNRLVKVLQEAYDGHNKQPKFTFFIVNKRINTRIFLDKGKNVDNPVSGTVVDNTVTLPERYDFYLVSQAVRNGTVTPTSYHIIYDTNEFDADKLQVLTYKQTHLYYNWSGTVRVPAVVQYAHKLAFLVGEFLHQAPSESFKNRLYFL